MTDDHDEVVTLVPPVDDPGKIFGTARWTGELAWPRDDHPTLSPGVAWVFFGRAIERLALSAPAGTTGDDARLWAADLIADQGRLGNVRTSLDRTGAGSPKSWFFKTGDVGRDHAHRIEAFKQCGIARKGGGWVPLFVRADDLAWLLSDLQEFPRDGGQTVVTRDLEAVPTITAPHTHTVAAAVPELGASEVCESWRVRPDELQKQWIHREDVIAEANRTRKNKTLTAYYEALAQMCSRERPRWTAANLGSALRVSRKYSPEKARS